MSPSFALRGKVFWFGPPPDTRTTEEFEHRGLVIDLADDASFRKEIGVARGLVVRYDPRKPGALERVLSDLASLAIDHGLKIFAIADNDSAHLRIVQSLQRLRLPFQIETRTAPPPYEVPERIARHDPGPPSSPRLEISGATVDDETRLLLQRAFGDCESISLKPLEGGYSANVYCIHAKFVQTPVGAWPLPFFAKVDERNKILEEWDNYEKFAVHFIPFYLRPNLDLKRCIVGATLGILVGNFVEQSEPLWNTVTRGTAPSVIYSLFDQTMRGWCYQAYQGPSATRVTNIFNELRKLFDPGKVTANRLEAAQKLGASRDPKQLVAALEELPAMLHRVAPIHGDLHSRNVRIRGTDAVLIDFRTADKGPFVTDLASLEVDLAFFSGDKPDFHHSSWQKTIDDLYKLDYFEQPPPSAGQGAPLEWLRSCVRQLRLLALSFESSPLEYGTVVAIQLLRHSMFPADHSNEAIDEYRRSYAYVVADRLIKEIQSSVKRV